MKVLEHGSPRYWKHRIHCNGFGHSHPGCGALLLAEGEDLFLTLKGTSVNINIKCPDCGQMTVVQSTETMPEARIVPDGIIEKLRYRNCP